MQIIEVSYSNMLPLHRRKILAVEKDSVRFATLQKLMKERGVECVTYENRDFTKLSLDLYGEAHYIFLDPTCSASGKPSGAEEALLFLQLFL